MEIITTTSEQTVATIGFFDGVHRGHQFLIHQVREEAQLRGMKSMAVTFPVHPRKVLCSDFQPQLLTVCDEKVERLSHTGIDYLALLDFSHQISEMSALEFMKLLKQRFNVKVLVIGYDHRFGHNREESFDDYVKHGQTLDMDIIQAEEAGDNDYSSTKVRHALEAGDVKRAADILAYPYFLRGEVVHGFHNGTAIGFPTANIRLPEDKLIPKRGVYFVRATLKERKLFGMLNIGSRPTLNNGSQVSIEVNLFADVGDLYGEYLRVDLLTFIREERKFDSLDSLRQQLEKDKAVCKSLPQKPVPKAYPNPSLKGRAACRIGARNS